MIYRDMIIEDYGSAYELWENTEGMGLSAADSEEAIRHYLQRNAGFSQICEGEDGVIAGTALCGHDGRRGFLYHVAVSNAYRGHGIGRILVHNCLRRLHEAGIEKCHLMVIGDNELGRSFWSGIGWQYRDGLALYSKDT